MEIPATNFQQNLPDKQMACEEAVHGLAKAYDIGSDRLGFWLKKLGSARELFQKARFVNFC